MPRSCPCRTCGRFEEAKEERIRRRIYMFFFVDKLLLRGTVHNLPIARQFFRENRIEHDGLIFLLFFLSNSVLTFQCFRSQILVSNFCFPITTSFRAILIGYEFSRPFPLLLIFSHQPFVGVFSLYFCPDSCLTSSFAMENAIF